LKIMLSNYEKHQQISELYQELEDFWTIFWDPASPQQRDWARQMIRSIENELGHLYFVSRSRPVLPGESLPPAPPVWNKPQPQLPKL
tara:strand:+ start:147 stop:407 length:261 start_codon:yes stop_codon:yes gene_type:complete